MSVNLYDESLCNKINGWLNTPNLKVLGPNETSELFGIQADIKEDKPLTLPLITYLEIVMLNCIFHIRNLVHLMVLCLMQ